MRKVSATPTSQSNNDASQCARYNSGRLVVTRKKEHVWGDAGYQGIEKRPAHKGRYVDWLIAMRPGKRAQLVASSPVSQAEKSKASVRARVEHCFHRIKCQFGYNKVRYRGLEKNTNTSFSEFP